MTLRQLMDYMETLAPSSLAEEWDNVGLLCGDADREIDTVVVALDADRAAIAFAKDCGAQVIVSHHPIIFSPVRSLTASSALYELAVSGIASFAAHTNLDAAKGGVNDALAAAIGLQHVQQAFGGIGRVGELSTSMSPKAFAAFVGEKLGTRVQLRAGTTAVKTVAMVSGSGGEYIGEATADAFLTGEVKHHEWLDVPPSMTIVSAGHYATEAVIVEPLSRAIAAQFPMLRVIPFIGKAPYETVNS